jgi:hypothetical protein
MRQGTSLNEPYASGGPGGSNAALGRAEEAAALRARFSIKTDVQPWSESLRRLFRWARAVQGAMSKKAER